MDLDSGLKTIEHRIFQARGVLYEGDVFSVLRHSSFVIRSFEFGLADGAINCTSEHPVETSYADRFWDIHERRHTNEAVDLVLFDVKSTVAGQAGEQAYVASTLQQQHVAFFIGITAAGPAYVEIIPNYHQAAVLDDSNAVAAREVSINTTRTCKLPASTYGGLDQCGSPYRMPIWQLPEAIARIRRCAQGVDRIYVNPGNGVPFPNWRPRTTRSIGSLAPSPSSDQYSAYELILDILRFANRGTISQMRIDFMGTQPRLADFRMIVGGHIFRIQHKLDLTVRSAKNSLSQVPIGRGEGSERRHYFSAFDRFDFLWYQFCFSRGHGRTEDVFYVIPERALPDSIFETTEKMFNFNTIQDLQSYRVVMDGNAHWLQEVERIIHANHQPRKLGDRPLRPDDIEKALAGAFRKIEPQMQNPTERKGRHDFAQMMSTGIRRFFTFVMTECASRLSGLLVVFATNHPVLDIGFCRYRWTEEERTRFLKHGYLPKVAHQLPSQAAVVPICYYTQYAETYFQGPNMRAAHFRRLNSSVQKRLVLWDIGGPDDTALTPVVIPSEDFAPTDSQREILARNVALNKNAGQRDAPNPNLSALLNTGLHCADYAAKGSLGPIIYEHGSWGNIWELLDGFSLPETLEHPQGHPRNTSGYAQSIQDMDKCLRLQHEKSEAAADVFDY